MTDLTIPDELFRQQVYPVLMVISGPSAAGKDAVIKRMREQGHDFHFVVTTTSRPRRDGEVEGVDYYFVAPDEFAAMARRGELLERADVYRQNKGIARREIQRGLLSGKDVVLRVDVQGAATLRRLLPGVVTVFLTPESAEELKRRLVERRTETPDQFEHRLVQAQQEIGLARQFDYVVVNPRSHLDAAVGRIVAIIAAEKSRSSRQEIRL